MWDWIGDIVSAVTPVASGAAEAAAAVPWGAVVDTGIKGLGLADQMGAFGQEGLFGMRDVPDFNSFGAFGGMGMGGQMPGLQAQAAASGSSPQAMRRTLSDAQSQGLSGASPEFLANLAGVTPEELQKLLGYGQA